MAEAGEVEFGDIGGGAAPCKVSKVRVACKDVDEDWVGELIHGTL